MKKKDAFTDIAESLPQDDNSEGLKDDKGNQQVYASDGEIVTLGYDSEDKK